MHIRSVDLDRLVDQCKDRSLTNEEMAEKLLLDLVDAELKYHVINISGNIIHRINTKRENPS